MWQSLPNAMHQAAGDRHRPEIHRQRHAQRPCRSLRRQICATAQGQRSSHCRLGDGTRLVPSEKCIYVAQDSNKAANITPSLNPFSRGNEMLTPP